jgi:hypothetical protein
MKGNLRMFKGDEANLDERIRSKKLVPASVVRVYPATSKGESRLEREKERER